MKREDFRKKETKAALKDFSTKELTDELIKRGGIKVFYVDPYEPYAISVNGKLKNEGTGPATLIVNID